MKTIRPKPEKISIFAQVSKQQDLVDLRRRTKGIKFGKIEDIARQYNIVMAEDAYGIKFTATKNKLQIFAEKLHFAGVQYWAV